MSRRPADFVKDWLLPPGVTRLLRALLRRVRFARPSLQFLRENRQLHGRHAGRRGFILGTGPSIKTQDLTVLRGEICISVSNFFVHPDYAAIAPRYHCVAPLHPPFTEADGLRWFREMEGPLAGRELFLGLHERPLVLRHRLLSASSVHYLALNETSLEDGATAIDLDGPLPATQSVSLIALLVALYLGFDEIYLIGVDHTSVNLQTGAYAYRHFYTGTRANALGEMPPPSDLEREFSSSTAVWRQYKALRAIATARGVRIVNATRGGLLDVFPRVTFESLFPSAGSPPPPTREIASP